MKVKTSELTGAALDWAVAKCEGIELYAGPRDRNPAYKANWVRRKHGDLYLPSTDWAQGGPIIERERISVGDQTHIEGQPTDSACYATNRKGAYGLGPKPLTAAMRCYVASELGDEVDVPDELGS
jgi:hypothetical protein